MKQNLSDVYIGQFALYNPKEDRIISIAGRRLFNTPEEIINLYLGDTAGLEILSLSFLCAEVRTAFVF